MSANPSGRTAMFLCGSSICDDQARRPTGRLEIHCKGNRGSWFDIAETELSMLTNQSLNRQIPNAETLTEEDAAWRPTKDAVKWRIEWRQTTADAGIKARRLYSSVQIGCGARFARRGRKGTSSNSHNVV